MHAPLDTDSVVVCGGVGVGPVGSPAEQLDVGAMQTGQTPKRRGVVVMVVVGLWQLVTGVGLGAAKALGRGVNLFRNTRHIHILAR